MTGWALTVALTFAFAAGSLFSAVMIVAAQSVGREDRARHDAVHPVGVLGCPLCIDEYDDGALVDHTRGGDTR